MSASTGVGVGSYQFIDRVLNGAQAGALVYLASLIGKLDRTHAYQFIDRPAHTLLLQLYAHTLRSRRCQACTMPCSCQVQHSVRHVVACQVCLHTGAAVLGFSHVKSATERLRKCSDKAFQLVRDSVRVFCPDEPLGSLPDTPLLMSLSARNVS